MLSLSLLFLFSQSYIDPKTFAEYETEEKKVLISVPIGTVSFEVPSSVIILKNGLDGSSGCFFQCHNTIQTVTFAQPCQITHIGDYCFHQCSVLKAIKIYNSVEYIGKDAFRNCSLLIPEFEDEAVLINSKLQILNERAFQFCDMMKSMIFPPKLQTIGYAAFENCLSLKTIDFMSNPSLYNLGNYVFKGCTALDNFIIPDNCPLLYLPFQTFTGCSSLKHVHISNAINQIGEGSFIGCESLEKITVSEGSTSYKNIDDLLFNKNGDCLIIFPPAKHLTDFDTNLYNTVTKLSATALNNVLFLERVVLSAKISEIEGGAFDGSAKISKIEVSDSNPTFKAIDNVLYTKNMLKIVYYPAGRKDTDTYLLPQTIEIIESYSFSQNLNIKIISLEKNGNELNTKLRIIGKYAFYKCLNLVKFDVGNMPSLEQVQAAAFYGTMIDHFSYFDTNNSNDKKLRLIAASSFCSTRLTKIDLTPYTCFLETSAFDSMNELIEISFPSSLLTLTPNLCQNDVKLTTVKMGDNVQSIEFGVFKNAAFTSFVFPKALKTIGEGAFSFCRNLKELNLPSTLTSIASNAFSYCESITTFNVPEDVKEIGNFAFDQCKHLERVFIPNKVSSISNVAFYFCQNLENFIVNDDSQHFKSIKGVLYNLQMTTLLAYPCGNKSKNFEIPQSVEVVNLVSFYGARFIEELSIGNQVSVIAGNAFYNNLALKTCGVHYDNTTTLFGMLKQTKLEERTYFRCPPTAVFTNGGVHHISGLMNFRKILVFSLFNFVF